jgi:hypothetical protein
MNTSPIAVVGAVAILAVSLSACAETGLGTTGSSPSDPEARVRPSVSQSSPHDGGPADCESLLDATTVDRLKADGLIDISDAFANGSYVSMEKRYLENGGFVCAWSGSPDSGHADLIYAYSPQTDEQRESDEAFTRQHAKQAPEVEGLSVFDIDGSANGESSNHSIRIAFGENYWLYVYAEDAAAVLSEPIGNVPVE